MSGRLSGKYDSERGKIIDPMRNDYFTPRDPGLSFAQTH